MVSAAVVALFVLGVGAASTRPTGAPSPSSAFDQAARQAASLPAATASPDAAPAEPPAAPAPVPPAAAAQAVEKAMTPPPPVFDAPPVPPPPAVLEAPMRQVATSGSSGGTWAVIIGINDYPGDRNDLRSAVNDAADVDTALAGMGVPVENRLVLLDGQATAARIRDAVEWLASRAAPEATAVFFYGGHVRKLGAVTEAIVAADGGLVDDRELGERLSHVRAARAWIAMASCYGGGFTEVLAPGRILTGAAPADALAYESGQYGRSYLVQYMVREAMIQGRAAQSVQAAFTYAVAELAARHPTRLPVQIDAGVAPLDLRPVLAPVASPPPAAAPSTPPATPPPTVPCRRLLILACG